MEHALMTFDLAPPGPSQPHHAPVQPLKADLEVPPFLCPLPYSYESPLTKQQQRRHWAEKIFDEQPHSTTPLRHRRE